MKTTKAPSFGLATLKEEGAPVDPREAVMCTGPGATEAWFEKQCRAFFDYRRKKGDTEEELQRHPYYRSNKCKGE